MRFARHNLFIRLPAPIDPSRADRMRVGMFMLKMVEKPTGMANYTRSLSCALRTVSPDIAIVLINPHYGAETPPWFHDFETFDFHGIPAQGGGVGSVIRLTMGLAHAIRRLGLDIIHAPGNIAPFIGPRMGVKRVVTVHDVAPLVLPREHSLKLRAIHATLIPPLRWTADAVITVSRGAARDIARYAHLDPEKIVVTPLGADYPTEPEISAWRHRARYINTGRPYFLAVGDVTPRKNLSRVLAGFAQVLAHRPDVRLIIAGKPVAMDKEIVKAIAGQGDAVSNMGYVDNDVLNVLYAGATALVFPSLYEGFGLPVLEAMARGTPVITSNATALPEVAGSATLTVDPTSAPAIAHAMLRVANDDALARDLAIRGRERARQFTWKKTAEQTLDVYKRVHGSDGQSSSL